MNIRITEVEIYPANQGLVRAYANIVFDNCLMIRNIRVIKESKGLCISMPSRKHRNGAYWQIVSAHPETRSMIQQAVLAEYQKVVGGSAQTKQ